MRASTDDDGEGGRLVLRAVLIYALAVVFTTLLLGIVVGGTIYLLWWTVAAFVDHISETD